MGRIFGFVHGIPSKGTWMSCCLAVLVVIVVLGKMLVHERRGRRVFFGATRPMQPHRFVIGVASCDTPITKLGRMMASF